MRAENKRNQLLERKGLLSIRKFELTQLIRDLKIPNYRSPTVLNIFREQIELHHLYAKEIHNIEKEFIEIKNELRKHPDDEKEIIKNLIKDEFGLDYLLKINDAVERINNGEEGVKARYVSDNQKELLQYKSKVIRLQNVIIEARKQLTNYIGSFEHGLTKSDYAAFLKNISKLNQSIPHHSQVKDI